MKGFKLLSFVVRAVLLCQIPHAVLSRSQTFHDLQDSNLKIITPVTPVDSNVIDVKQSSISSVLKRVARQSGNNGFTYSYSRNIPGIGDFKISANNKGVNMSYGRPNQGQDQMQRIIKTIQNMGNSVMSIFSSNDNSSTDGRTFMSRFNEALQRWTKAFGNLAPSSSNNHYTYSYNRG